MISDFWVLSIATVQINIRLIYCHFTDIPTIKSTGRRYAANPGHDLGRDETIRAGS